MAVPAKPFYLSAAYTEFGKALNTGVSGVMTTQGLVLPDYAGDLAGKSQFTPTNQLTVGTSVNSNSWGWNPQAATPYGSMSPQTTGSTTWTWLYVSTTKFNISQSASHTATYRITFDDKSTIDVRFNNLTGGTVVAGDEAACIAKVTQSAGKTIGVSIVKIA